MANKRKTTIIHPLQKENVARKETENFNTSTCENIVIIFKPRYAETKNDISLHVSVTSVNINSFLTIVLSDIATDVDLLMNASIVEEKQRLWRTKRPPWSKLYFLKDFIGDVLYVVEGPTIYEEFCVHYTKNISILKINHQLYITIQVRSMWIWWFSWLISL